MLATTLGEMLAMAALDSSPSFEYARTMQCIGIVTHSMSVRQIQDPYIEWSIKSRKLKF